jgi:hypothetical protein
VQRLAFYYLNYNWSRRFDWADKHIIQMLLN